jgi:hypothetical protein
MLNLVEKKYVEEEKIKALADQKKNTCKVKKYKNCFALMPLNTLILLSLFHEDSYSKTCTVSIYHKKTDKLTMCLWK